MMETKLLKLYAGIVLLSVPVAALRTLKPEFISSLAGFAIFFLLTIVLLKKVEWKSPLAAMLVILLGISTIELLPRILGPENTGLMSLSDSACRLIGVLGGYLFTKIKNRIFKTAYTVLLASGMLWVATTGTGFWFNKVQVGTYTGFVGEPIGKPLEFYNEACDTLQLADLGEEYIVLMGWHSDCGACKGSLNLLQQLYDRYKDNPKIKIYSCLCLQKFDNQQTAASIAGNYGFTFPSVFVSEYSSVDRVVRSSYNYYTPVFLILDPDGNLLYKAGIHRIEKILKQLVRQ